jgi:predicted Zn-ribbon and HTH transcriptional regulator
MAMGGGLMQFVAYGAQNIYLLTDDIPIVKNTKRFINKWKRYNKLIDLEKNSYCPVKHEDFEYKCQYCVCKVCKYNFDADTLMECLKNNNNCPMCRSKWTNFIIYTNEKILLEEKIIDINDNE